MPELPEVETIVRQLKNKTVGKKIKCVQVLEPTIVSEIDCKSLNSRTIEDIKRRGKYIIFELSGNKKLVFHLRFTGKLLCNGVPGKYSRLLIKLDAGNLLFDNKRKLGTLELSDEKLQKLGIEPLDADFNAVCLKSLLLRSRLSIKDFLLDQHKIAGIGNIYASEILFAAGIHPGRKAFSLKDKEVKTLVNKTKEILKLAIKYCGTSVSSYRDAENKEGSYREKLKVYGREDKSCYMCQKPIRRIRQRGRSTYFCPLCQK